MKCIFPILVLTVVSVGATAGEPRVIRKPVAEFATAKAEGGRDGRIGILRADLSPDGKVVACLRGTGELTGASKLTLYAVENEKPLFTAEITDHRGSPYRGGVAFSTDGKLVAFLVKGRRIEIRSTETGKLHAASELPGDSRHVDADVLAFSPDGSKLAVASGGLYHKDLHVFETKSGNLLGQPLKNVDGIANQLIFSTDGKRLIANHHSTIYLVDVVETQLVKKIPAKAAAVFVQAAKVFAVQDEATTIHEVTDDGVAENGIGHFADKAEPVNTFRMAVAGTPALAAMPVKNEITVRNVEGKQLFRAIGEDSPTRRLALSGDAKVLMVYRDSQRVEVFRLE
jgi:WD40 repeat protein